MKKLGIVCLLYLLTSNVMFSQVTYPRMLGDSLVVITADQMKVSNLIFLEHEKLLKTDSIKDEQIKSLKEVVEYSFQLDTLYNNKVIEYEKSIQTYEKKNKKLKKTNKIFGYGWIGSSLIAIALGILAW